REENPALGWRAVRMGLDRPALLRLQLRALLAAAHGRELRVMFPLIATVEEFRAARDMVDVECEWALRRGRAVPAWRRVRGHGGSAIAALAPRRASSAYGLCLGRHQ